VIRSTSVSSGLPSYLLFPLPRPAVRRRCRLHFCCLDQENCTLSDCLDLPCYRLQFYFPLRRDTNLMAHFFPCIRYSNFAVQRASERYPQSAVRCGWWAPTRMGLRRLCVNSPSLSSQCLVNKNVQIILSVVDLFEFSKCWFRSGDFMCVFLYNKLSHLILSWFIF
jgi:hypothetical protein